MKKLPLIFIVPLVLMGNEFQSELLDEITYLKEETFVLSASRVKEDIKKTSSSVTVITSETIEQMGANNILDVLATVPGIGITQSNIQAREIEARGIKDRSSKQILFMLDGHALDANLINGGSIWSLDVLNLDSIKRIEVIKGPASSLYGSSAFVALVNIITKNADDIDGSVVKVRYASSNTREADFLYGKKFGDLSVVGNLNVFDSDGDSVYVYQDRSKNSGYTNPWGKHIQANIKLDYKNFYLSSLFSKREDGPYFGAVGNINDSDNHQNYQYFVEMGYKYDLNDNLNISSKIYIDKIRVETYWELFSEGYPAPKFTDGIITDNGVTNEKNGVEVLTTYRFNKKLTTILGGVFERQKQYDVMTKRNFDGVPPKFYPLDGIVDFSDTNKTFAPDVTRDMYAVYINNLYDINDDIRLTFGARYDDYSKQGSNLAPRGGLSWQVNSKHTLKFTYGEGFRVPQFAELYNTHILTKGNPDLKSETVKTTEVTLNSQFNRKFQTKVTLFNNDFKDLIVKVITPQVSQYQNFHDVNTRGLEFETVYTLVRGSYIKVNYTYQEATDKVTGYDLPDVPANKGNIFFNYRLNKYVSIFNHLFIKGKTKRVVTDTRDDLDGYSVYNLAVSVKHLHKNTNLKLAINNLFDSKVYDPAIKDFVYDDYRTQQRNISFQLKYKF